jgi:hypothetical protein
LKDNPKAEIRVLAVWEPILPTDVSKPISIVLNRLSDSRVTQFWDKGHVLATRMAADARAPQPTQECCIRNNHLWDLVAFYPANVKWGSQMPTAMVFDGPVVRIEDEIRKALASIN